MIFCLAQKAGSRAKGGPPRILLDITKNCQQLSLDLPDLAYIFDL